MKSPVSTAPDDVYKTLIDFGDFTLEDLHHQLSQASIDLSAAETWFEKDQRRSREYVATGRRGCDIAGKMIEHLLALGGRRLRNFTDPGPGIIITGRGGPMDGLPFILTSRQHRMWYTGAQLVETGPGETMPQLELGSEKAGHYDPHPTEDYGDWTPVRAHLEVS